MLELVFVKTQQSCMIDNIAISDNDIINNAIDFDIRSHYYFDY
jgi:hypothetical protein